MSVAVAVLDRDDPSACTDNIAVVDAGKALITWIPRDLWCECLQARINAAYGGGGAGQLIAALAEHGYPVEGVLVLFRAAAENALRDVTVEVPVDAALRFLYPMEPRARLEDGAKEVRFDPPAEILSGERIHQWLGARRVPGGAGSDLDRIRRQQVLLRRLLEDGFDFRTVLVDGDLQRWTGPEAVRDELRKVRSDWFFETFDDVVPRNIGGQSVLISRRGPRYSILRTPLQGQRRRLLDGLARRVLLRAAIPGAGLFKPARRFRLLAVLAVRNEARFLPGWFDAVLPHVDGVIALDDGSTDETPDLLAGRSEVLELIRIPASRPHWDEVGNHRLLVAAALRHHADWILALDADERPERDFRARAERVIRRGSLLGIEAYALRLLELWDSEETYRVDGLWGRKIVARLFRALDDHRFDARALHGIKAPLQASWHGRFPVADLRLYHLRMIGAEDRANRRLRYEMLDPNCEFQPGLGYGYLTDEAGLKLQRVSRRRGYLRKEERL
jgi:hypothetical protein